MKTSIPQPNPNPSFKQLIVLQVLSVCLLTLLGFAFSGFQLSASIAVGGTLMLANLLLLAWSWHRLMAKKSIAWTTLIIVIKYAVLFGSVIYMTRTEWFSPLGAGIGVTSFMIAALALAALNYKKVTG